MRIGITRWVLIGASLWMGTVRPAAAEQPIPDGWTEHDAWQAFQVPAKPITAYPAGDLWADFCTEPVYFHHPCGRNDCTGDGTCTLLDGVNAYHAPLGSRCGTCGINRCSTCAPVSDTNVIESATLSKRSSTTSPAPVVQGNRNRRNVAKSGGQPTPAAPRHQADRKATPKSERPRSVRVEAVDGRPRPVTMEPISPVPLAPADLVAAIASDSAQWVEGIPESVETDELPESHVQQAAAYEPVADERPEFTDELQEVEVQTKPLPAPVVRQASHVRNQSPLNRNASR